jgi:hypothetical protein
MNEDIIVEAIADGVQARLTIQSSQRAFTYQTLTPVADSSGLAKIREPVKDKGKTKQPRRRDSDDEDEGEGNRRGEFDSCV